MPKKTSKKSKSSSESASFENSLAELEKLVERMEKGELSLEDALSDFQHGIELSRNCQDALKSAEQQVQILLDQSGQDKLAPFDKE